VTRSLNHLLRKTKKLNAKAEKDIRLTWSRASTIIPTMIGHTIVILNGKEHLLLSTCYQKPKKKGTQIRAFPTGPPLMNNFFRNCSHFPISVFSPNNHYSH